MKKPFYIILLFVGTLFSQNNTLNYDLLKINNTLLNSTKAQLLNSFNIAEPPSDYYNELTDEDFDEYSLNENKFYFSLDKLVDFTLKDNTFYFMNPSIKVGNNVNTTAALFPNSFSNKKVKNGLGYVIINLTLNSGLQADQFIVINYNSDNLITSIHLGEF